MLKVILIVALVALVSAITVEDRVTGVNGGTMFLSGELGTVALPVSDASVARYVQTTLAEIFELSGVERFVHVKTSVDRGNNTHTFFQQFVHFHNKLVEVDGGEVIIHTAENGAVFAISSSVLVFNPQAEYTNVKIQYSGSDAITAALNTEVTFDTEAELVFVIHDDAAHFAYRAQVTYDNTEKDFPEYKSRVFVSPHTAELIVEFPLIYTIENRTIYNANQKTVLPGTVERVEGGPAVNDQTVNQAYDNSGICYKFFFKAFNRDSWDGKGAPILSTVHFDVKYNNAFFNGKQMVYGDGDGVNFSDFAGDLSVVCHEITHGVVSSSANLRYSGESGALNEAYADMFGASAVIYHKGGLHANTWEIGSECYLAGEALRYMNNPVLDGSSRDYYPNRYVGILDNGGVHWNSGIGNLFFVLLVQGGTHPQQKTTNYVAPVGIVPALDIVYDTLIHYLTATSNFAATRSAMSVATKAIFPGDAAKLNSVTGAWTAVGVN